MKKYTVEQFDSLATARGLTPEEKSVTLSDLKKQNRIIATPKVDTVKIDTVKTVPTMSVVVPEPKVTLSQALAPRTMSGGGYVVNPLLDIVTLPSRALAKTSGQRMSDPESYFLKPLVESAKPEGDSKLAGVGRGSVELLGQVLSDPLSFVGPTKAAQFAEPIVSKIPAVGRRIVEASKQSRDILPKLAEPLTKLSLTQTIGNLPKKALKQLGAASQKEGKSILADMIINEKAMTFPYTVNKMKSNISKTKDVAENKLNRLYDIASQQGLEINIESPLTRLDESIKAYDLPGLLGNEELASANIRHLNKSQEKFVESRLKKMVEESGLIDNPIEVMVLTNQLMNAYQSTGRVPISTALDLKQYLGKTQGLFKDAAYIEHPLEKQIKENYYLNLRDQIAKNAEESGIPTIKEQGQRISKLGKTEDVLQDLTEKSSLLNDITGIDVTKPLQLIGKASKPIMRGLADILPTLPRSAADVLYVAPKIQDARKAYLDKSERKGK